MGTKPSPFQPDHSGKSSAVNVHCGMHGPARGSDAFQGHHVPGNIARDGAPKNHRDVPVHSNMRSRIAPLGGMIKDVHGAPDASSPQYLDIEPKNPDKQKTVPIKAGMRSRTSHVSDETHAAIGRAVLDDALSVAGSDHPENIARRLRGG